MAGDNIIKLLDRDSSYHHLRFVYGSDCLTLKISATQWGREVYPIVAANTAEKDRSNTDPLGEASGKVNKSETSDPLMMHLVRLIQNGKLRDAFQLITKNLKTVSRKAPEFFFLNLYAGEFVLKERNVLIKRLVHRKVEEKGAPNSSSFATEFVKYLPEYDKASNKALSYLLTAWNNIYLVSGKDYELSVTRLTDAFFALVKPYISHTLFGYNSDRIEDTWLPSLDAACTLLNQMPVGKIFLEGHTDDQGPAEHNLVLSRRRAEAVRKYLVSKGIREDLISAEGKGESFPIESNDTPEGRAENRRVEISLSIRFRSR